MPRKLHAANAPDVSSTRKTPRYINANPIHRKHLSQRDVPSYQPPSSTYSGLTRRTCGRCTRTRNSCSCIRGFPPHISTSSVLLNVLQITWGGCGSFSVNSTDPNLQCGTLEVPMDYHDSSAGKARLAVIKYASTVPKKQGTVFFNPGDPIRHPFVAPH